MDAAPYRNDALPTGVRSRFVSGVNGLYMHILEAGFEEPGRPAVLLLHGFPELAYSWRKIMPALEAAGYHVIAPDQRGYGRTTGWDGRYDGDVGSFRLLNIVTDALCLVHALGIQSLAAVVGHDFGSPVAAYCALIRPDIFTRVALMSAPFGGAPRIATEQSSVSQDASVPGSSIHEQLAALARPRKHYHWYYSTRSADGDMHLCPQGVHAFLRAYYHYKSADWRENQPHELKCWTATELEKMPTYYIMDDAEDMAQTVAPYMPAPSHIDACKWLPDDELAVYATEFERTGFQGGLQWYRCATNPALSSELKLFSGKRIEVPACFIAGKSDWGVYQKPGDFAAMQRTTCADMKGVHLLEGAGHWVQQEQPARVSELLLEFLQYPSRARTHSLGSC